MATRNPATVVWMKKISSGDRRISEPSIVCSRWWWGDVIMLLSPEKEDSLRQSWKTMFLCPFLFKMDVQWSFIAGYYIHIIFCGGCFFFFWGGAV